MSRIYFHAQFGEAEVYGPERGLCDCLTNDLFIMSLGLPSAGYRDCEMDVWEEIVGHKFRDPHWKPEFAAHSLETHLRVSPGQTLKFGGRSIECFAARLNTALKMGSDVVKLAARIHGQCEIHGWVSHENRLWLAGLIEKGRQQNIFRPDMGWEDTITLLRRPEEGTVVMSYSVCEQFPGSHVLDMDEEKYDELGEEDKWRLCMTALRERNDGLELTPVDWDTFYFREDISGFDIAKYAHASIHQKREEVERKAGRPV